MTTPDTERPDPGREKRARHIPDWTPEELNFISHFFWECMENPPYATETLSPLAAKLVELGADRLELKYLLVNFCPRTGHKEVSSDVECPWDTETLRARLEECKSLWPMR